jgi:hypothetical protein
MRRRIPRSPRFLWREPRKTSIPEVFAAKTRKTRNTRLRPTIHPSVPHVKGISPTVLRQLQALKVETVLGCDSTCKGGLSRQPSVLMTQASRRTRGAKKPLFRAAYVSLEGRSRSRIERSLGMIFAPGGRPACDRLLPYLETEAQAGQPLMTRVRRQPGTGALEVAFSQKIRSTIAGGDGGSPVIPQVYSPFSC